MKSLVIAIVLLSLTACERAASQTQEKNAAAAKSPMTDEPAAPADAWAGKWEAANGDYVEITPTANADYTIFIKGGADGPSAYQARAEGGMLRFSRGGEELAVSMTGTDCLFVALDETYCRDNGKSVDRSDI